MQNQSSLKRTLTLTPVVLFGLAYMAPMTVFTTYGVATQISQGMLPLAYLLALVAMIFTAYSYGRMVKAYPVAGSAYTYTQKSMSPHAGFLVGWAVLMDYLFLPMINYLVAGIYLAEAFPSVPQGVWVLLFIVVITLINILGIKLTTNINTILIVFQTFVIILFMAFSIKGIMNGMGTGTLLSINPFVNGSVPLSAVIAGSSILCLSFLGFDAVSTLSEETINSEKTIPKAILLVTLIGGALFIIVSYVAHMVYPDFNSFKNPDSAASEIAEYIGGALFGSVFIAGMLTACFASGLSAHASVSRLLYAMGRDGVISQRLFGYIHPKFKTPFFNIILVGAFALVGLFVDLVTATSFINFGALVAFTFVNLSVIAHYYIRHKKRAGTDMLKYLICPLIGACFNLWLWTNLDSHSFMLGCIWIVIGIVYLAFLTKMFTKRPPEMNFDESEYQA
ncbi:APC family permease [Brevibacillus fluminis]|uniref:APC family permease n=1 Tax=Brevibacillus fluminis TaxID=511487 RepID=A0A3M8D902_9BACL|nr:APC family permease [Brevibacillus fluminis]RNB84512.1 APC family permease [Brevibacillus fluminis]